MAEYVGVQIGMAVHLTRLLSEGQIAVPDQSAPLTYPADPLD
jgi:hypothetical protein